MSHVVGPMQKRDFVRNSFTGPWVNPSTHEKDAGAPVVELFDAITESAERGGFSSILNPKNVVSMRKADRIAARDELDRAPALSTQTDKQRKSYGDLETRLAHATNQQVYRDIDAA